MGGLHGLQDLQHGDAQVFGETAQIWTPRPVKAPPDTLCT